MQLALAALPILLTNGKLYTRTLVIKDAIHQPDGYPINGIGVYDLEDTVPIVRHGGGVSGNDTLKTVKALPGPEIRVKHGDQVRITVVNEMADASTSVHWHGLHQNGSQWSDGVAFITQCPTAPGGHFVYEFNASQNPGTFFYHSHSVTQYDAGLTGAFIIEARNLSEDTIHQKYNYSKDEVVHLMDWVHVSYIEGQQKYLSRVGIVPNFKPDYSFWPVQSILINGRGQFDCGFPVWNGTHQETRWITQEDCDVVNRHSWPYLQTGTGFKNYTPGIGQSNGQCQPIREPYMGKCTTPNETQASTFDCPAGKMIRLRFINSAAGLPFALWADRHIFTVVALDGRDVTPVNVSVVLIAIGQRIDVILSCNQDAKFNYKMFASYSEAWYPGSAYKLPGCWNATLFPDVPPPGNAQTYAIIKYTSSSGEIATQTKTPEVSVYNMTTRYRHYYQSLGPRSMYLPMFFFDNLTSDPPLEAPPAVKRIQVAMRSHNNIPGFWNKSCPEAPPEAPGDACSWQGMNFEWYSMNNRSTPARVATVPYLPTPILLSNYLGVNETTWIAPLEITLEYDPVDPIVYEIIIVNHEDQTHPMHFHGFSLYRIGYGYWTTPTQLNGWKTSTYNSSRKWRKDHMVNGNFRYVPKEHGLPELNETMNNSLWVDSITLPPRGFVVLRIRADNPGAWYVHCHMDLHLVAKMALILKVAYKNGTIDLPEPPDNYPVCGSVGMYSEVKKAMRRECNEDNNDFSAGELAAIILGGFIALSLIVFVLLFWRCPVTTGSQENGASVAPDIELNPKESKAERGVETPR
mmetsp:Transcript_20296/g.49803  ORF Transcript_20296/g.49803 Transcript_20296/m.49803 type:complete len:802 (+) Transcript_20296:97-2502(+)